MVSGVLLTVVWGILVGGLQTPAVVIYPGMLAYIAISLWTIPILLSGRSPAGSVGWILLASVTMTDLVAMTVRNSPRPVGITELCLGVLGAVILIGPATRQRKLDAWAPRSPFSFLVVYGAGVTSILVYQAHNRFLRHLGVPNKERSLFIGEIEIHHINWGIILLVIVVLLWPASRPDPSSRRLVLLLALGTSLGMIWDQWFYYMLADVTDDAYFHPITPMSALLILMVSGVISHLYRKRLEASALASVDSGFAPRGSLEGEASQALGHGVSVRERLQADSIRGETSAGSENR